MGNTDVTGYAHRQEVSLQTNLGIVEGFGVESGSWEPVTNLPKAVLDTYYTLQKQAAALFDELDDDSE